MAIAPIDLQTLFAQVDKVGKTQAAQKDGQAIQQAMHGVQIQRKTDAQIQQVNEAQDAGDTEKINDRTAKQKDGKKNKSGGKDSDDNEENDEKPAVVFRDPSLGNKIDISY